jgi:hypothetical protein
LQPAPVAARSFGEITLEFQVNPDDADWAMMLDACLNGRLGSQGAPKFSGDQQGMGIAWMDWGTQNPNSQEALGVLNSDGSRNQEQLDVVIPLRYYPR